MKLFNLILGLVVNGLINVVITTIERRFGLSSSQTGLIAGGYDVASFLLLIPVSFLGGRINASKPRFVSLLYENQIIKNKFVKTSIFIILTLIFPERVHSLYYKLYLSNFKQKLK